MSPWSAIAMDSTLRLGLHSFLRNVDLFSELDDDALATMVPICQPFMRQPGEPLFSQGDPPDGMYMVERGEVSVQMTGADGHRVTLAELGAGAVVGEMSLATNAPRSAAVVAVSLCHGYWIGRARFDALRRVRHPAATQILLNIGRTLEMRRRITETRLRALLDDPDRADKLLQSPTRDYLVVIQKA